MEFDIQNLKKYLRFTKKALERDHEIANDLENFNHYVVARK